MPHATTMCDTLADFVVLHKTQLESSGIPKRYWDTLFTKLKNEMFDAGEMFGIMQVQEAENDFGDCDDGIAETEMDMNGQVEDGGGSDEEDPGDEEQYSWQVVITNQDGVDLADPRHVYLIDHAWTYRIDNVREQLTEVPGLRSRMAALMEIPEENRPMEDVIDDIFTEMWRYNQTYKIGNADLGSEAGQPIWYIMDEFGSRVQHSDSPSARMVPFYYVPSQMTFTIMWPLKVMCAGDEVTRDYIEGGNLDHLMKKVKMLPWQPDDMTHLSYAQHEMDDGFFNKFKVHETLPNLDMKFPGLPRDRNISVYTDIDMLHELLTDNRFEFVNDPEEADIWWTRKYLNDFRGFSEDNPSKFISQFPFEMVFTVKDLLAMVARRSSRRNVDWTNSDSLELNTPKWLQTTYNLQTELPQFVSYFQQREQRGLDNHWIAKPWNLSRSLDMHITSNLNYILRLPDTGPKIACKYVEDPVLFELPDVGLVKFDMRFVVMLSSVHPLKIMAHNKFLVRLANKEFSLDKFDDYEKHFTVMQYKGKPTNELPCEEFMTQFEDQYPEVQWPTIQTSTYNVITEMFEAACDKPPPKGVGESPQSRAIYGVDLMLKWETDEKGHRYMQPVLFEVNFVPDIRRLANFYPDFFNECFAALFLDDFESGNINIL